MSLKKTDLEKNKASKLRGQMVHAGIPSRFGAGAAALPDRREQRKIDQAAGLVPFAVKLPDELVTQLRDLATQQNVGINELTDRLIRAGLAAEAATQA
jgi:hypothetical protein